MRTKKVHGYHPSPHQVSVDARLELIAKFLEKCARDDDYDRELAPSLKRLPQRVDSWNGWIGQAEELINILEKTSNEN